MVVHTDESRTCEHRSFCSVVEMDTHRSYQQRSSALRCNEGIKTVGEAHRQKNRPGPTVTLLCIVGVVKSEVIVKGKCTCHKIREHTSH